MYTSVEVLIAGDKVNARRREKNFKMKTQQARGSGFSLVIAQCNSNELAKQGASFNDAFPNFYCPN